MVHGGNKISLIDFSKKKVMGPPIELKEFKHIFDLNLLRIQSRSISCVNRVYFALCGESISRSKRHFDSIKCYYQLMDLSSSEANIQREMKTFAVDRKRKSNKKSNIFEIKNDPKKLKTARPNVLADSKNQKPNKKANNLNPPLLDRQVLNLENQETPEQTSGIRDNRSGLNSLGVYSQLISANVLPNQFQVVLKKIKQKKASKLRLKSKQKAKQKTKIEAKKQHKKTQEDPPNWQVKYNALLNEFNELDKIYQKSQQKHQKKNRAD